MIYCYNCGKKNSSSAEYCVKCDTQLFHGMPGVMRQRPGKDMSKLEREIREWSIAVLIGIGVFAILGPIVYFLYVHSHYYSG